MTLSALSTSEYLLLIVIIDFSLQFFIQEAISLFQKPDSSVFKYFDATFSAVLPFKELEIPPTPEVSKQDY